MAIHQPPPQRETVERVMHEFKHGELKSARGTRKVKNPKQAVAIALSEAGASKYDTPKERTHNLRRTKAKERRGETGQAATEGHPRSGQRPSGNGKTRSELYQEATRRDGWIVAAMNDIHDMTRASPSMSPYWGSSFASG